MSQFHYRRRHFLFTAAGVTGAFLLKGCGPQVQETAQPTPAAEPGVAPEVTTIRLGFLPIVESAPLIIAKEKGFFAKYGMPGVEVVKQASWASARDNVVIGSAAGGIDGGMWQLPMPHLITEGVITNGQKVPMYVLAQLITQGNGIAIAGAHQGKGLHLRIQNPDYIKGFSRTNGRKFRAAFTFPGGNQELWIRYWLAANGIDPDKDIELLTVPPAETVQGMRTGTMDAFSTGDPWPFRIVNEGIGFLGALTAQMWPAHPEEYLAIRADWVDKHPKATLALLQAVMAAQQWCDDPANRKELATILAGRNYFNVPVAVLEPPFQGKYTLGDGQPEVNDFQMGPLYWQDRQGNVSYPYKSHELWFLTETMRWGLHNRFIKDMDQAKKLVDRVNRADLWLEAAKLSGIAQVPTGPSRGKETFFDGVTFDPDNPQQYLAQLQIKRA
ncbi:MAG: CmpA/NrtA family ABC transporter substrate-binding protein [Gloeomargarita sp. SKYBB_i_bin120]|nr:ABC transporter substrate-binding protein [Gloeomargarita sp. SKYB120]MDW8177017.1 CmpA/NrtA family ABC transporter substrate-binding protein [Gloeomargarita sp. SKYBB_i_bin120]